MNREAKEQIISKLSGKLNQATFAVLTDFRGLNVEKMAKLRNELRSVSSDYRVAKNTFLKKVSQGTELEQLHPYLVGPTAIVISHDDPIAPSKVLAKFMANYSELNIKIGFLEGKILSAEEVKELSRLPGRKELLSRMVSMFTVPQMRLLNALSYLPLKLVQVFHAIKKSKSDK